MRWHVIVAAVLWCLAVPGGAIADESLTPEQLHEQGNTAMADGDYAKATDNYRRAMEQAAQHRDPAANRYRLSFARAAWAQVLHAPDLPDEQRGELLADADRHAAEAIRQFLEGPDEQLADHLRGFGESQLLVSVFLLDEAPAARQDRKRQGLAAIRQAVEIRSDDLALRRYFLDCLLVYPSPAVRDLALEQIRYLLEANPDDHVLYARRAALNMVAAEPDGERTRSIEADLQRAIELSLGQEEAYWLQLAAFYEEEGRTDEITPALRKALRAIPVSTDLRIAQGMHLLRRDRVDEATAQLTRLAQDQPRNPTALLALARLHIRQRQPKNAYALAQRAGTLAPDDETPLAYIAQCQMLQRRPARAASAYRHAREVAIRRFHDLPRSIDHAREALGLRAKIETLAIDQCQMWLDAAAQSKREKDRSKCLSEVRSVLKETPEAHRVHPLWYTVEARLALAERNEDRALGLLEQAHGAMAGNADKQTTILLTNLYIARDRLREARHLLEQATADNRDPLLLTALAGVLLKSNEKDQASALLDEVLQAHPRFAPARKLKAQLKKDSDDPLPPF